MTMLVFTAVGSGAHFLLSTGDGRSESAATSVPDNERQPAVAGGSYTAQL